MTPQQVHILVTCNNPELERFSFLVFDTIRIGFPTAEIFVYDNNTEVSQQKDLIKICEEGGFKYIPIVTIHHLWIEERIKRSKEPFWIVDTDIVFYQSVEHWKFNSAIAGYATPEFKDTFTGCITKPRLHTSLMRIDPAEFLIARHDYQSQFNITEFNPPVSMIYPCVVPVDGKPHFYDTMSVAYNAIGGTAFTDEQKEAYFHFHFGTLSDRVLPRLQNGEQMKQAREAILNNPELGRGVWREQDLYYAANAWVKDGGDVIAKIKPEDSRDAVAWNRELCCGDVEAMRFCDLWYGYVHGIDDLVDTMKDGRPTMSKRQMISLFFHAAILYNNAFYKANQQLLFPIILDITQTYITSVEWEKSPHRHQRMMADVFRTCGNRMYSMVALICGGDAHSQEMSQRIHNRDWLGQHDEKGKPI